jgi:hypothetical protein
MRVKQKRSVVIERALAVGFARGEDCGGQTGYLAEARLSWGVRPGTFPVIGKVRGVTFL